MVDQGIKITRLGNKNSPIKTVGDLREALSIIPDDMPLLDGFDCQLNAELICDPCLNGRYVQISACI